MIARNLNIADLKFIPFRKQVAQDNTIPKKVVPSQLTDALTQRNTTI